MNVNISPALPQPDVPTDVSDLLPKSDGILTVKKPVGFPPVSLGENSPSTNSPRCLQRAVGLSPRAVCRLTDCLPNHTHTSDSTHFPWFTSTEQKSFAYVSFIHVGTF